MSLRWVMVHQTQGSLGIVRIGRDNELHLYLHLIVENPTVKGA